MWVRTSLEEEPEEVVGESRSTWDTAGLGPATCNSLVEQQARRKVGQSEGKGWGQPPKLYAQVHLKDRASGPPPAPRNGGCLPPNVWTISHNNASFIS